MSGINMRITVGMTGTTIAMADTIGATTGTRGAGIEITTGTVGTYGEIEGTQTEKDTICGKITVTWDRMFKSQCNRHRFRIYRVNSEYQAALW
jgi:hypothetical protein